MSFSDPAHIIDHIPRDFDVNNPCLKAEA